MALHKGENPYIYGFHDSGGEHLMLVNGEAKGWTLVTEAIGTEAHERGGSDYRGITDKGIGLIVRLNQSYGENGTIPREARYPEFAQRVANFVEDSKGANIWLIGNEMNFSREQPRRAGSNEPEPITPRRYATCYKMCRNAIHKVKGHEKDLVVVGSMAPWNPQTTYPADPNGAYPANPTGDWIDYLRDILLAIGPSQCDAISIHAYSHGYDPNLIFSKATMNPPFQNRHYNFYTYRDQMNAIPKNMRHLPVYLTEANGDKEANGDTWPFGNNGWIKNAYREINSWNQEAGHQQIRCMILFRWMKDHLGWSIDGKPAVQQDFREAVAKNYKWKQVVTPVAVPPRAATSGPPITIPTTTGITIEDISSTLPINASLAPYPTRAKNQIRRIIINHSATPARVTPQRIAQVHATNRPGIVYHYCIIDTGAVYKTLSLEVLSNHAGNFSADSVGICLIGDFTDAPPPDAQLGATAALLAHVASQLSISPDANTIVGRSDLVAHASPGATWARWKEPLIAKTRALISGNASANVVTAAKPSAPGYLARYLSHNIPSTVTANQTLTVNITLQNAGIFTWKNSGVNPFRLGFKWFNAAGQLVRLSATVDFRTALANVVVPNQTITLQAKLRTPSVAGVYRLQFDMVHEQITWFADQGDPGLVVDDVVVGPSVATGVTSGTAQITDEAFGFPIEDISATLPTNSNLTAYSNRTLGSIKRFVLNHTVTSPQVTPQRIAQYQVNNEKYPRPGIAYHYCITDGGKIYQTQPLTVISNHAGQHSTDSIGLCLIGNFTDSPPPASQIKATSALIAHISGRLNFDVGGDTVFGYSDLAVTGSPGATWSSWKDALINQANSFLGTSSLPAIPSMPTVPVPTVPVPTVPVPTTPPPSTSTLPLSTKVIEHYLLFWHHSDTSWAEWDLVSAIDYIGAFRPTVGFSVEEAKLAKYVTIVGGVGGVSAEVEQVLRAAGCKVERLDGATEAETNQMLYDLIKSGKRFKTLQ